MAAPGEDEDWKFGPPLKYMRQLCAYWADRYDWRAQERLMNSHPHYIARVNGREVHFVHVIGSGRSPRTLLIIPGWPYSFHSYAQMVDRLAHPERFGGKEEDAFTVVIPSIPGFDFSEKPVTPIGPKSIAELFDKLMVSTLGYDSYIAHGGDWGAVISEVIGYLHPRHVAGIHLSMLIVRSAGAPALTGETAPGATEAERAFAAEEISVWNKEGAYAQLESTKPLKLSYAMADSPVGVAAWIVEAFHAWSDRRERPFEALFTPDQLLTEVMLYLVTDAFATSIWVDASGDHDQLLVLPPGERIDVPVGIAAFPDPVFLPVPREIAEMSHNVIRYTVMPHGGHFPCYEAPNLLIEDLRGFSRQVRNAESGKFLPVQSTIPVTP